jgi:RNA polymerase sigma factor (sigma-70 family)
VTGAAPPTTVREPRVLRVAEPTCQRVEGDRFDDLFRRLYPDLYGLVRSLLGDAAETEDVVQEAFLKLVDAPVLARPDAEAAAWLRRVAINLGLNRLRGERRARERLERTGRLEMATGALGADDPGSAVLRREAQAEVRRALARLPGRQSACLLLRYSGYSYAEIATTVGIAAGSVGVLLARAERAFREAYEQREGGEPSDELP